LSGPAVPMDTRVSLFLPLTVIGVFAGAQLMLGTSPAIIAMGAGAVVLPFLYLGLYGRDLYGLMGIAMSLKYVGFALVAKTFYGQTLESNLYDPYAAFGLTLLIMFIVTAMLILARELDRGKAFFDFPMDLVSLRRLSVFCICIGLAGVLYFLSGRATEAGAETGGAAVVLGTALREYYYLGLIAESVYAVIKTNGRSFITGRLVFLFLIQAIISISFNEREVFAAGVMGIAIVAYLYNLLRIRHVIIGIVFGSFFIFIFTPISIYLRLNKTGLSLSEFTELAENTIVKAATDPAFFKKIADDQKYAFYQNMDVAYDYYGMRSEVLDRLSFISLVDAVYNGTRNREPLGMEAVNQLLARNPPSFLGYNKDITTVGFGDWLSWQTGLEEPGVASFTVFGLPMEGLATWGVTGLIVYPFIFMLPLLYICGRLSSFRLPLPLSIFLFSEIQHLFLDSSSDIFLGWMTRNLLVLILGLFALHYILRPRAIQPRAHAV
jgi:hypothetical protein